MVAAPNFTLLCLHVETFRVSDSPEVSLTQVAHEYINVLLYTWGEIYMEKALHSDFMRTHCVFVLT